MASSSLQLVDRISVARSDYDTRHSRALAVGTRVRHNVRRGMMGVVVEVCKVDSELEYSVRYEDHQQRKQEPRHAIHPTEMCTRCDPPLPREVGGPCPMGHWLCMSAQDEMQPLGDLLVKIERGREDRILGMVLCSAIGDALGAPFEGWGSLKIRHAMNGELPLRFIPGTHMGIRKAGLRCGLYTDDTNTMLALASSLVANGGKLDAQHIASEYARFYYDFAPPRGMPDSAIRVLDQIRQGSVHFRNTAMYSFPFGSFANGAAMRIAPLAALLSNDAAHAALLPWAVSECCISSHVHPDAVVAAMVQCRACIWLLDCQEEQFDANALIEELLATCGDHSPAMSTRLQSLRQFSIISNDEPCSMTDAEFFESSGIDQGFQLYAPDGVATALYFLLRYRSQGPEMILRRCVGFGGDCDTTGAMVGAYVGALWGTHWIPAARWYGLLENQGQHGRDYMVQIARKLAQLAPLNETTTEHTVPLFVRLQRARLVLCSHFNWPPDANVVERASPYLDWSAKLWQALFDACADAETHLMGYDVACALMSLKEERFVPQTQSLTHHQWMATLDRKQ